MSFNKIHRISKYPRRADKSAIIGINLSWEVRQEARRAVGARVVDERLGGPSWSPAGGDGIVFLHDGSQGNRTRATIKAINAAPHRSAPPSPLRHVMGFS